MTQMNMPLVLSLRPHYADMVFVGTKKAELRRRMASVIVNRSVFVYVTSPVREIRGGFHVGQVWKGTPEYIWQSVSNLVPMDRAEFDTYYSGCDTGVALEIDRVWEYGRPIPLGELRRHLAEFVVPQSWRYLRESEQAYLETMTTERIR